MMLCTNHKLYFGKYRTNEKKIGMPLGRKNMNKLFYCRNEFYLRHLFYDDVNFERS